MRNTLRQRELGLLSRDRSAPSGYNGRQTTFWNLFGCRLTEWSTIVSMLHKGFHLDRLRSRMTEYNRLAYSKRKWSNTVRCKPRFTSFFSSLLCFFKIQKTEKNRSCDPKVLMAADSGMKDIQALIPIVGSVGGCQCGRGHTTICFVGKNLRMGDME